MVEIDIVNDIVPVGEFKSRLPHWLKTVRETHHPIVITQNGRTAGVLLSPETYAELIRTQRFTESVNRGLKCADEGELYTTDQAFSMVEKTRQSKKQK